MPGLFGKFSLWDVLVYTLAIAVLIVLVRIFAPRYFDKVVAISSLGMFGTFLLIVGTSVQSLSLRIVLIIAMLMAVYDFWLDAFSKKNNNADQG